MQLQSVRLQDESRFLWLFQLFLKIYRFSIHFQSIFSMTPTIFLLVLLLNFEIPSTHCESIEKVESVNRFLDRKLREATMEIAKQNAKEESELTRPETYDIKWKKLWSEKLNETRKALPISVSNKMFLLEGDRLVSVIVDPASEKLSSALRQVDLLDRQQSPIKFVKSIVWKAKIYLLICHNNIEFSGVNDACTLYTGNDNSNLQGIQILKLKGSSKDAVFFTRANRLYLVVVDNTEEFPVNSLIYRWMGTYMDIIQWAETSGAVSVTAFNHRSSTILVFGQNAKGQPNIGSEVYELNDGGLEKIQYLATNGPISVGHYFHNDGIYLFVINEANPSNIYRWDGNEFVDWLDLPDIMRPSAVSIAQSNGDTLLFVSGENFVSLYKITSARYWRLDLLELEVGEKVVDMAVWIADGTSLTLLLVTLDQKNLYKIEPWELRLKKLQSNKFSANIHGSPMEPTEKCLRKLHNRLEERTKLLEAVVHRTWPILLNSQENLTVERVSDIQEIILESGSVTGIEISSDQEMLMPGEINRDFIFTFSSDNSDISGTRNASKTNTASIVSSILADSRKIIKKDGKENRITGEAIIIKENAFFQEFQIDYFETDILNERSIGFENEKIISLSGNQVFSDAQLCGKSVTVRRLEIDNICGIPNKYWLRSSITGNSDESTKNNFINSDIYVVDNETLVIRSDLISLQHLKLRSINDIDIGEFFDGVFIKNQNQRIKGNILYKNAETSIEITHLISDELNKIPSADFWTRKTNQHLRRNIFVATKASIGNIVVERINGIPVEQHAMVSKKNIISGPVTISNIHILEELMIENATKFLEDRPVQIYDQVTITGNVTLKNLVLEQFTKVGRTKSLSNDSIKAKEREDLRSIDIEDLLRSSWRKSAKQIIKNPVSLKSLTIDKLTVKYLNDIDVDSDVIKTSTREIVFDDSQGSIEFANFTVSGWIFRDSDENQTSSSLYDDENDGILSFNTEFRIERLGVHDLYIKNFNGIPLDIILREKNGSSEPFEFSTLDSVQRFETVTINDLIKTDELVFSSVNEEIDVGNSFIDLLLRSDENYELKHLKTKNLTVRELNYSEEAVENFPRVRLSIFNESLIKGEPVDLRIDGNLEIEEDARFRRINDEDTQTYLDYLAMDDVAVISDEELLIDYLLIGRDLTLNLLHGSSIDSLLKNTLSKTQDQKLSDIYFSFYKVTAENVNVTRINNQRTSDLPMIDSYRTNIVGNVSFSDLKLSSPDENIEAMMKTGNINRYRVDEIYDRLGKLSARKIENLEAKGNINWKSKESKVEGKLERILTHGVVGNPRNKSKTQEITSDEVTLTGKAVVGSAVCVKGTNALRYRPIEPNLEPKNHPQYLLDRYSQIKETIDDFVLDDPNNGTEIELSGLRNFRENFEARRANVVGNVGIESLNDWRVNDLKSQIVDEKQLFDRQSSIKNSSINEMNDRTRSTNDFKDKNEFIGSTVFFRQSAKVENLQINSDPKKLPINSSLNDLLMGSIAFFSPETRFNGSTFFEHLSVVGDVNIESLDQILFDDFVENRVTIDSDRREIHTAGKFRFKGRIRVSDEAKVLTINRVDPSNLLLNGSFENETIVCVGEKIFESNVESLGKTLVKYVGGIDVVEEYRNAVRNNENVDIFGDVTFQADVESLAASEKGWELPKGYINDFPLSIEVFNLERSKLVEELANINRSYVENLLIQASNPSISLPEIFYYFESEDNFRLSISGIERVESMRIQEDFTRLDIYGTESGNHCGLSINDCHCRVQYVAEIDNRDFNQNCRLFEIRGSRIFYNFREENGAFGVSVATTTVSKNDRCSRAFVDRNETIGESITEYTTISWIKPAAGAEFVAGMEIEVATESNVTQDSLKIYGFLSDVRVFTENDLVFIVLAIYFDPIRQSHETNSYIYVLDLENNVINLLQTIPTIRTTSVEVFKIPRKGSHVLFSTDELQESGKSAESVLYRLDPLSGQFRLLRKFATGGNRNSKIVHIPSSEEPYLLLDDRATNSIRVYRYDGNWDNFYFRQSLRSPSMGATMALEILYSGEFHSSDVYVIVTTENDQFFVYEYMFFGGFRLMSQKFVSGIRAIVPFDVSMSRRYALVANRGNSTMLRIVQQGPGSVG